MTNCNCREFHLGRDRSPARPRARAQESKRNGESGKQRHLFVIDDAQRARDAHGPSSICYTAKWARGGAAFHR